MGGHRGNTTLDAGFILAENIFEFVTIIFI